MPSSSRASVPAWLPLANPTGRYSSGISDLDRLLGGGFAQGSFALFELDDLATTEELDLLFAPLWLNFLHHSRGIIAVLPARDSPQAFRGRMLRYTTRRRFDSRVRVIDYVGEGDAEPYVVSLVPLKEAERAMKKMAAAERAAQGARGRSFLEFNAFETIETVAGPETASRMVLFGVKRARQVRNLVVGLIRPGLALRDAVRSMADCEIEVSHHAGALVLRGIRPSFPPHRVVPDPERGPPSAVLRPAG